MGSRGRFERGFNVAFYEGCHSLYVGCYIIHVGCYMCHVGNYSLYVVCHRGSVGCHTQHCWPLKEQHRLLRPLSVLHQYCVGCCNLHAYFSGTMWAIVSSLWDLQSLCGLLQAPCKVQ